MKAGVRSASIRTLDSARMDALLQRLEVKPWSVAMMISPSITQRCGSSALIAATSSGK